jgi:putative glutamine amidotransferase
MKPLIGISCCVKLFGVFGVANHAASDTYVRATDLVVGGVPMLIPANGTRADVAALVARLDGFIFTGSRSNVAPDEYEGPPHAEGTPEDRERDAVTLRLIRAAVAADKPVLAICRGLQEFNVAMGGSLHQRLQDLPDRMDHSTPSQPNPRMRQGKAHRVSLAPGSWLHRLAGRPELAVNSLHNQGIDRLGNNLVAEAWAPDGTIEAIRAAGKRFAVGVQWHPEYDYETDEVSRAIFTSFGQTVRAAQTASRAAAE